MVDFTNVSLPLPTFYLFPKLAARQFVSPPSSLVVRHPAFRVAYAASILLLPPEIFFFLFGFVPLFRRSQLAAVVHWRPIFFEAIYKTELIFSKPFSFSHRSASGGSDFPGPPRSLHVAFFL